MEDDCLGVGVVEEIEQLLGLVAVVGVDRGQARLEGGIVGLQVLRRVVEIGRDLGLMAEPGLQQMRGQGVGPPVKVAPADDPLSADLGRTIRRRRGDLFPDVGEVPAGHARSPVFGL